MFFKFLVVFRCFTLLLCLCVVLNSFQRTHSFTKSCLSERISTDARTFTDEERFLIVGVILTFNNSYHWSMPKIRPGIENAVESINRFGLVGWEVTVDKGRGGGGGGEDLRKTGNSSQEGKCLLRRVVWRLKLIFADSKCSDHVAPMAAFDMYVNKSVNLFVGPACEYSLAPVARYSPYWNIPVITAGAGATIKAFTDKGDYKQLTRMSSPNNKLGFFLVETLRKCFNWKLMGFVFEDSLGDETWRKASDQKNNRQSENHHVEGTRNCYFLMEAVYDEVQFSTRKALWRRVIKNSSYQSILTSAAQRARIILICASNDEVRKILLTADELGFNNGEYIFINIDLFSSKSVLERPWFRAEDSEELNSKARKAFETLMTVTLSRQDSPEYREFSKEVRKRSHAKYGKDVYGDEVNDYVGSFHDALILYSLAANETIHAGLDPRNGSEITRRMWNRTFKGISGEVSIDANGDREEDYSILNMDPKTGIFEVVGNYLGRSRKYERVVGRAIYWPANRTEPPPDIPKCGFDRRGCPPEEKLPISAVIAIVLSIILFMVLVSILFLYRHIRMEAELSEVNWRVKWEDISFVTSGIKTPERVASIHSLARKGSFSSHISLDTLPANEVGVKQIFTATGHYKSTVVAIKKFDRPFTPTKPLLIRIKKLRDLQNDHIVRFIGVCIDHPNQSIITEYCQKGSLQDVLENDSIKLDRMFKFSLVQDLVRGISYLHNSDIRQHGNLKSSNCVVDSRFVLKITDFGFLAFRNKGFLKENDNYAYYKSKLWTAPEILREEVRESVTEGSQKGDVYSFAIICQEIVLRKGTFWVRNMENMPPKEIVSLVRKRRKPYFRPTLLSYSEDGESCEDELLSLIQRCWAEDPIDRPDFNQIKSTLKRINKVGGGGTLLDNLLSRMEQYACNLEGLVQERTADYLEQKKRAEDLLYMMLPRSVAAQLMQGLTVKAEKYDNVTIYFSDICGFTSLSAISTPMQVVDFLNDLYTSFDVIIEQFDVYKVETIGDAYMVVSGLPVRNGILHAREISRLSLKLLQEVKSFKIRHRPEDRLMLRIGIHSGPVCAGVVGHKMPRYCLFGDTVNTASRMESNGEALKIHVSPETKEILDIFGTFTLSFRGPVAMKGKGEICTWWLLGEENPDFPELSPSLMRT